MKKFAHLIGLTLLTAALLSFTVFLASADEYQPDAPPLTVDTIAAEGDFDSSRYEIVNPRDIPGEPVPAPCECNGEKLIYQINESGYIKGIYAPCSHGLNGNVYTNQFLYVVQCQTCGQGEAFSRRVTLTQCNH